MTELPLSPVQMVEFFKDKEQVFELDYDKSVANLQNDKFLLMYIANLGIKVKFDKIPTSLVNAYMTSTVDIDNDDLRKIHANVLHYAKFGEVLYEEMLLDFPVDSMVEVIVSWPNTIAFHLAFMNSSQLYMLSCINDGALKDQMREIANKVVTVRIDDIGVPIMRLFSLFDFMMMYMKENPSLNDQLYFERYFDDYMFGGKNMFSFVANENNGYLAALTLAIADQSSVAGDVSLASLTATIEEQLARLPAQ